MTSVLVVDDDPTTVQMLTTAMSIFGYDALAAHNGEQALEKINAERPDVVLLDLMMPGIDGFETLRRIRANPEFVDLPVIVVTASQEFDLNERVHLAGGTGCMRKPVDLGKLSETISQLVGHDR